MKLFIMTGINVRSIDAHTGWKSCDSTGSSEEEDGSEGLHVDSSSMCLGCLAGEL